MSFFSCYGKVYIRRVSKIYMDYKYRGFPLEPEEISSAWLEKIKETYAEQYKQGYSFYTNCLATKVKEIVKDYETKGLEVFVGEKAFCCTKDLHQDSEWRAILVRKKQE